MANSNSSKKFMGIGGIILALCLIGVIIAGIIGFIYRDDLMALMGEKKALRVAKILPADTTFYASVTPNIQNMAGYDNLKKLYFDNPEVQQLIEEAEQDLNEELTGSDFSYEEDIKPWLGAELVFAASNFEGSFGGATDPEAMPDMVVVAMTKDKAASDQFVQERILNPAEANDHPFTSETYQDVTIYSRTYEDGAQAVLASFNDFVVGTTSDLLMKEVIDLSQSSEPNSLADDAAFKQVSGGLPQESIFTFYMATADFFETLMSSAPVQMTGVQQQSMEALTSMGVAGILQPNGIQMDTLVNFDLEKMTPEMKASLEQSPSPNAILENIPESTLFFYNLNNLKRYWEINKQSLEANPDFQQGLQDFEEELGISIEEDIFSWMTGEAALALIEIAPPDEFTPPIGGYLLVGTDDVENAQSHLDKVVGAFEESGLLPPTETQTVDNIEFNALTDGFSEQPVGGFGFYEDYFFMAYQQDSIRMLASEGSINDNENFQMIKERLPGDNVGYMYVDFDRILSVAESQMGGSLGPEYEEVRPLVEPIHAVGIASQLPENPDSGMVKGRIFILISE